MQFKRGDSLTRADMSPPAPVRLVGYSAAAAASVGAASGEEVSLNFDFEIPQFTSQPLDLNLDGQNDLVLENYVFFGGNYQGAQVLYAPGQVVGFAANNTNYASALAAGDPINATTVGPGFDTSMAYGTANPNAQWNSVTEGFLGLSFPAGETLFYAWVRLSVDNATGAVFLNDSFASDDPNGIVAGQEPALGLLGDYNNSGQVEQGDLDLVLQNWGSDTDADGVPDGWTNDLPDGVIDQGELDGVLQLWGSTAAAPSFAGAAVPEPGSLGFLAAGAGGLLALRRRRRLMLHQP